VCPFLVELLHAGLGDGERPDSPSPITFQLLLKQLHGGEALDVPQALDPLDPDPFAIQVSLEAEQMHLKGTPAVLERGTGPLIHHATQASSPPLDCHRVDAVWREELSGVELTQIDGRHFQ
jgi:hypothetical protein